MCIISFLTATGIFYDIFLNLCMKVVLFCFSSLFGLLRFVINKFYRFVINKFYEDRGHHGRKPREHLRTKKRPKMKEPTATLSLPDTDNFQSDEWCRRAVVNNEDGIYRGEKNPTASLSLPAADNFRSQLLRRYLTDCHK